MLNLKAIEEIPNTKWIDNLPQVAEIIEPQLPTKSVVDTYPIPIPKRTHESNLGWRSLAALVGIALYAAAVANNVYASWSLSGLAFWVVVAPSVLGETGLLVAIPFIRWGWQMLVAVPLAAIAMVVVMQNEIKVIAQTTSDQAHVRGSQSVSEVDRACPQLEPKSIHQGRRWVLWTPSESEACRMAKASAAPSRPEAVAFREVIAWATQGWWVPTLLDFDNIRVLSLILLLNSGGGFLWLARRR